MQGWTLYIQDSLKNTKQVRNPEFIPRKGDRVGMGYAPAPIVKEVVVSYEDKTIAVVCE